MDSALSVIILNLMGDGVIPLSVEYTPLSDGFTTLG
jgi:hypothetical protein